MKLTIKRRKDLRNNKTVAPFIDGYNVWDVPPKQWTEPVQMAIINAYCLGWAAADRAACATRQEPPNPFESRVWEEEIE